MAVTIILLLVTLCVNFNLGKMPDVDVGIFYLKRQRGQNAYISFKGYSIQEMSFAKVVWRVKYFRDGPIMDPCPPF